MKYKKIIEAKFINRPNRFIAEVEVNGEFVISHVKNTGRCKEILVPGARVYLEDFSEDMKNRKLRYSLIGVKKVCDSKEILINIDSQAPNKVVREALQEGKINLFGMGKLVKIKPEVTYNSSRLDFYVEDENGVKGYIEVKGVTLENDGVASFPDAPTERGIKHLNELSQLAKSGYKSYVIFVIQMEGMKRFTPNEKRHKAFKDALKTACEKGVNILAYECKVPKDSLTLSKEVKVEL